MRGMNLRLVLLVICLAGNVLLAMALLRHGSPASTARDSASADNLPFKTHAAPASAPSAATEASSTTADADTNAPPFTWLKFTTADFAMYIKQLRAFGTPEKQVREIIMGAIDATYRPRRAALMPPPKKRDDTKFWVRRNSYGYQSNMTPDQRSQMRALRKEESDLVKSTG